MHALEAILASHSGRESVSAGEIITIEIDVAGVNDLYVQVLEAFWKMGGKRVWAPDKVVFFFDHYSPPSTAKSAINQRVMREFIAQQGIERLYDIGEGVCHPVLFEDGLATPGSTLCITDSHATTHGAYGAFSIGVGATDMAAVLLSGRLWVRVPEIMRVDVTGEASPATTSKDIMLYVLKTVRADGAVYKAVEYSGPVVDNMSLEQRAVLTNMSVEMGAKASFIAIDSYTLEEFRRIGHEVCNIQESSEDYEYNRVVNVDVSGLEPQIALPGAVDRVVEAKRLLGTRIDQAYIGGCAGGLFEDIKAAAYQLRERSVRRGVKLIVSPATRTIYLRALEAGYVAEIVRAGGTVINPGCGPCLGVHQGVLAPGEVCVTSTSRNFPGRMGSAEARIYLTSSATAAASAAEGMIALPDPEDDERAH